MTRKKKSKVLSVAEIKQQYDTRVVVELSLVRRAAHFFDWAATHYPYQWIPWNWTLQAILGQARTPKQDSHAVLALRSSGSRIRGVLQRDYRRDFIVAKGLGARANVDSADTLKTQGAKAGRRVRNAIVSAQKTFDLIDPKQIPDTPENVPWKRWYSDSLKGAMRKIGSAAFARKLLAPIEDDDGGKKK
jgi:hypothetical protein